MRCKTWSNSAQKRLGQLDAEFNSVVGEAWPQAEAVPITIVSVQACLKHQRNARGSSPEQGREGRV